MNVICVDDEPLAMEYTLKQCGQLPEIDRAEGFTDAESALTYLREHSADIVHMGLCFLISETCFVELLQP